MHNQKKIKMMGVVNLTPDSFSDGHYHQNPENFQTTLEQFQSADILDIGLESTAPMNNTISSEEEINRFNLYFVPFIDSLLVANLLNLSIDTYKIETIKYILDTLEDYPFKIIWNDISGRVDGDVIDILKKYPKLNYVYCYNLSGNISRNIGAKHMDYVAQGLELQDVSEFFHGGLSDLANAGILRDRIYLDLCFGFSKSFEQNIFLLDNLESLFKVHDKWVFGISRKSFLRRIFRDENPKGVDEFEGSEIIHKRYLREVLKYSDSKEILIRLHNPLIFRDVFEV